MRISLWRKKSYRIPVLLCWSRWKFNSRRESKNTMRILRRSNRKNRSSPWNLKLWWLNWEISTRWLKIKFPALSVPLRMKKTKSREIRFRKSKKIFEWRKMKSGLWTKKIKIWFNNFKIKKMSSKTVWSTWEITTPGWKRKCIIWRMKTIVTFWDITVTKTKTANKLRREKCSKMS